MAEEHADIKKLAWEAEHAFSNNKNYDSILLEAINAFLQHAIEEETTQHPRLRESLTPEQNDVRCLSRV